jgi:hypothetical protein
MSVRSHTTRDSYRSRPLHNSSRKTESETEFEDNAPCAACKNCEYKQMVDEAIAEEEREQQEPVGYKIQNPKVRASLNIPRKQEDYSRDLEQEQEKKQPGLLKRFSQYVAKNQKANADAGETSLFDDMQKWGGGIMTGAGKLGQEEIDGLDRKKAATGKRDPRKDDELVDFLTGKKAKR